MTENNEQQKEQEPLPPLQHSSLDLKKISTDQKSAEAGSRTQATRQDSNTGQDASSKEASSSYKKDDVNIFQSYFTEMNEKSHEAMSHSQPEPERALEFLKQAEDFMEKIE